MILPIEQRLLTAKDLGTRWSKSVSTIYRMNCYTPEILPPSIKIGTALRWRIEDVEDWEAAQVGQKVGQ